MPAHLFLRAGPDVVGKRNCCKQVLSKAVVREGRGGEAFSIHVTGLSSSSPVPLGAGTSHVSLIYPTSLRWRGDCSQLESTLSCPPGEAGLIKLQRVRLWLISFRSSVKENRMSRRLSQWFPFPSLCLSTRGCFSCVYCGEWWSPCGSMPQCPGLPASLDPVLRAEPPAARFLQLRALVLA